MKHTIMNSQTFTLLMQIKSPLGTSLYLGSGNVWNEGLLPKKLPKSGIIGHFI